MKKITFLFSGKAYCRKSIDVPKGFKTKGKTVEQIYDELYELVGHEQGEYLLNNYGDQNDFNSFEVYVKKVTEVIVQGKNKKKSITNDN
jgi:hypothetical protein